MTILVFIILILISLYSSPPPPLKPIHFSVFVLSSWPAAVTIDFLMDGSDRSISGWSLLSACLFIMDIDRGFYYDGRSLVMDGAGIIIMQAGFIKEQ